MLILFLDLLSAARRVCAKILPNIADNLPSPLKIHRPNEENTSEPVLRDQQQVKHQKGLVKTDEKLVAEKESKNER